MKRFAPAVYDNCSGFHLAIKVSFTYHGGLTVSQRKKAYCAKHPKEGRCNAESITVANTYMRTVTVAHS